MPIPSDSELNLWLARIRSRARLYLVAQRVLLLAGCTLLVLLGIGALDYLVRFPGVVRWLFLLASLIAICWTIVRHILPAARFNPSLTDVAWRLELAAAAAGTVPEASGALASGSQLEGGDEIAREIRRRADERLQRIRAEFSPWRLDRLRGGVAVFLAACLPAIVLVSGWPSYASIGASRLLAPWSEARWPKRTGVAFARSARAHPAGQALPLQAILTRSSRPPQATDVTAVFRVLVNGASQGTQRALMTWQRRESTSGASGDLFERLVDVSASVSNAVSAQDRVEVEYWFETTDDATDTQRLLIVEPPAIVRAHVEVTPPAYVGGRIESMQKQFQAPLDDRAATGPILDGSRVTTTLELNRAIPVPGSEGEVKAFMSRHLPDFADEEALTTSFSGTTWTFSHVARQSRRAVIRLVDEYGIASTSDSLLRIDVVQDQPATAAILDPSQDESVLPTAAISVTAEGRDDVGVVRVRLTAQTSKRPEASAGALPEPSGEPQVLSSVVPEGDATALHTELRASAAIELSVLELNPGDELWLRSAVLDLLASSGDGPEVVSPVRRLRIISESTLAEQIQAELSSVREAAKRLAADQSKISASRPQALEKAEQAAEQRTRQDGVTDRLSPLKDVIDRLSARVERNRASDSALEQLLRDVSTAREEAQRASGKAAGTLDELGRRPADSPPSPEQQAALEEAQRQAEENLEDIVRMLDRGRDGWAARRSLERIITEQKQLIQQTQAGESSRQGKRREDLSQLQRDELDRQSQRQEELSGRTQALVDTFEEQSKQLEKADSGQSQAMKRAAETGRRQDAAQKQRDAAQQLRQNQTQTAQQNQQQAQRALEQMLGELEKAEQRRDEALRRTIAELTESLERLRDRQSAELSRLSRQIQGEAQADLPAGMISVNQATIAVTALLAPLSDPGDLPRLLESASNAQEGAILTLRAAAPDLGEADANERRSLALIEQAIAEARRLEESAEDRLEERARQELAKVYQEVLEQQLGLNGKVTPLIGKTPTRREASLLRAMSPDQEALRLRLEELRTRTDGLEETQFFRYAHDRLDESMKRAVELLKQSSTARMLQREQSTTVRVLASLVQALKNEDRRKDDLRDNEQEEQQQGGGQSNQPGVLPPGAELKLLRLMQLEAADRTRELEQEPDAEELNSIGELQQQLHQRAIKLLEQLRKEPEPPAAQLREPQGQKPPDVEEPPMPEVKPAPAGEERPS